MIRCADYPQLLFFKIFSREPRLQHFSTTRKGGVSKGTFESFNLGNYSDDDPLSIYENRSMLARMFYKNAEDLITPHQTHGSHVLLIDEHFLKLPNNRKQEQLYGYDASITQEKGFFLCITTADCVPILLFDSKTEAIAAIHAGWRGTVEKIVEKTILKMGEHFGTQACNIRAAIGPSIAVENFEVGKEVERKFEENKFSLNCSNSFRNNTSQKIHLNLKEINKQELIRLGVPGKQIEKTRYCTYKNDALFFSARRQTIRSGRMLTGIMLR